jgi:hypothetical protein
MAGVVRTFCLGGKVGSTILTSEDQDVYSDWLVVVGVGEDIELFKHVFFRTELTAAYCLTSKWPESRDAGITYESSSGFDIRLAAGLGHSFD